LVSSFLCQTRANLRWKCRSQKQKENDPQNLSRQMQ
jgi:hypothetical protein